MKKAQFVWGGIICLVGLVFILHAQEAATYSGATTATTTAPDSIVQLTAENQGLSLVSPWAVPDIGTFWVIGSNGVECPWPSPPRTPGLPIYAITTNNEFLVDATGGQVTPTDQESVTDALAGLAQSVVNLIDWIQQAQATRQLARAMGYSMTTDSLDSFTPLFANFDTNSLYLELTNVVNGLAQVNLHNGTNQVYAIWSSPDLSVPYTNWQVETEVFPTGDQTNLLPFTVATLNRDTLFLRAEDWTDVTHGGNTTPDWWIWKYFGTTDLADTSFDSFGNTLMFDYTNWLDPNVILFSLELARAQSASPANGSVTVFGGTPYYEAVLVNDTNDADAIWQPYTSSNVVVSLTAGSGLYTVRVGLRGRSADATQTWVQTEVSYSAPPELTLTFSSPPGSTVSTPLIQIQGLANAALSSLTYGLSNALGVVTNQPGYWQAVFYDTNVLQFTTNSFQCYDVPLTNGLNTITINATDPAGSSFTTNLNITLDYSGDTTPPALTLLWPTNGTIISGGSFTAQAQVDDNTATVTAMIADTNGNTNLVSGMVERTGLVWLSNLPLNGGTNFLTVTAMDAAGNVSVTNLTLIQSAAMVTMDAVSADQANQSSVMVTGTISDLGDSLTVNGVTAINNGDGTWEADNVPVSPTGKAGFAVQVTGPDNNPLGFQNIVQPQPPVISLMSYSSYYSENGTTYLYCHSGPASSQSDDWTYWTHQWGGISDSSSSGIDGDCEPENSGGETPLAGGYGGYAPVWEINNYSGSIYSGPPNPPTDNSYTVGGYSSGAYASVMIVPSGQAPIGQKTLYLMEAQVIDEDLDLQIPGDELQFTNQLPGTPTVDVTHDDSSVWSDFVVSAPAGATNVQVTPMVPGNISFGGMQIVGEVGLKILDANNGNQDLTTQTNTVIVGQQMNLICQLSNTNGPLAGLTLQNIRWTVPGYAISNYVVAADASSAIVVSNFPTSSTNVVFYWVDGTSNRTVQVSATVKGQNLIAKAVFNIYKPNVIFMDMPPAWATNFLDTDGTEYLQLGTDSGIGDMEYQIGIYSAYSGKTDFTQLINRTASNGNKADSTSGQYWLDSSRFYKAKSNDPNATFTVLTTQPRLLILSDGPNYELAHSLIGGNITSILDYFKDYIMFRPDNGNVANNIFVPLGKLTWSWSASTTYSGGSWSIPTYFVERPNTNLLNAGYDFPQWPQLYHNN